MAPGWRFRVHITLCCQRADHDSADRVEICSLVAFMRRPAAAWQKTLIDIELIFRAGRGATVVLEPYGPVG
jgi:hypothetical protein